MIPPPLQHQMSPGPCQPPQHAPPPPPVPVPVPIPHYQPPQVPQELPVYSQSHETTLGRLAGSVVNFSKDFAPFLQTSSYDDGLSAWHGASNSSIAEQSSLLYDDISARFNAVMTLIDDEKRHGTENDLFDCPVEVEANSAITNGFGAVPDDLYDAYDSSRPSSPHVHFNLPQEGDRGVVFPRPILKNGGGKKGVRRKKSQGACVAASSVVSFSKVELYGNSKLPRDLPSLAL